MSSKLIRTLLPTERNNGLKLLSNSPRMMEFNLARPRISLGPSTLIVALWCLLADSICALESTPRNQIDADSASGCDLIFSTNLSNFCQCKDDLNQLLAPPEAADIGNASKSFINQLACSGGAQELIDELSSVHSEMSHQVEYMSLSANLSRKLVKFQGNARAKFQTNHLSLQLEFLEPEVPDAKIGEFLIGSLELFNSSELQFMSISIEPLEIPLDFGPEQLDLSHLITYLENLSRLEVSGYPGELTIRGSFFRRQSDLRRLNLASNGRLQFQCQEEAENPFFWLRGLEYLNLERNNLERLPIFCLFTNGLLANLTSLNLMGNKLGSLERDFFTKASSKQQPPEKNLEATEAEQEEANALLPSLIQLDLSHNQLVGLTLREGQQIIRQMPQLSQLYLQHNKIVHVNLNSLLSRRAQFASTLPGAKQAAGETKLELLDLSHNNLLKITALLPEPSMRPRIKSINLAYNNLGASIVDTLDYKLIDRILFRETFDAMILGGEEQNYLQLSNLFNLQQPKATICELLSPKSTDDDYDLLNEIILTNNRLGPSLNWRLFDSRQCRFIQTLRLSMNQIGSIENGTFAKLASLEHLDLSTNLINDLPEGLFAQNMRIRTLDLGSNLLRTLAQGTFWQLSELEELTLSDNQLVDLATDIFSQTGRLTVIDLSNNRLSRLDERTFQNLSWLRALILHGNQLKRFNQHLFDQPPRRIFSLIPAFMGPGTDERTRVPEKAKFKKKSATNTAGDGVRKPSKRRQNRQAAEDQATHLLVLASNQIDSIELVDHCAQFLQNIHIIWLNDNQLQSLSSNAFKCPIHIQRLYLQSNKLQTIDERAFQSLANLEYLDLSHNRLAQISPKLTGSLSSLRHLDLCRNELTQVRLSQISSDSPNLESLLLNANVGLDLDSKELLMLMKKLAHSIRQIDLSGIRRISAPSSSVSFPEKIEQLNMDSLRLGDIQEVDGNFLEMISAISTAKLDLAHTKKNSNVIRNKHLESFIKKQLTNSALLELQLDGLNYGDEHFRRLFGSASAAPSAPIRVLSLASNQLDTWPLSSGEIESRLVALEMLDLSNNRLRHMMRAPYKETRASPLERLSVLNVSHNAIISLVDSQPNEQSRMNQLRFWMPQVSDLDLSHNRLTWLPRGFFDQLHRLKTLKLYHNQLETIISPSNLHSVSIGLSFNPKLRLVSISEAPVETPQIDLHDLILVRRENDAAAEETNFRCLQVDEYLKPKTKRSDGPLISSATIVQQHDTFEYSQPGMDDPCRRLMQLTDSYNLNSLNPQIELQASKAAQGPTRTTRFVSLSCRRNSLTLATGLDLNSHQGLVRADLSNNRLGKFGLDCKKLSHLISLDLSSNQLHEFPALGSCANLNYLDVSSNKLTSLAGMNRSANSLMVLKLNDNKVTQLDESDQLALQSLRFLDLRSNPLKAQHASLGRLYNLRMVLIDESSLRQSAMGSTKNMSLKMAKDSLEVESSAGPFAMEIRHQGQNLGKLFPESLHHSIKFCSLAAHQMARVCFKEASTLEPERCLRLERDPTISSCLTELQPPTKFIEGPLMPTTNSSRQMEPPNELVNNLGAHNETVGDPVLSFIDYLKTSWLWLRDLSQRLATAMNVNATNDPVWLQIPGGQYKIYTSTLIKFVVLGGSLCILVFVIAIFVSLNYLIGGNAKKRVLDETPGSDTSEFTCSMNEREDKSTSSSSSTSGGHSTHPCTYQTDPSKTSSSNLNMGDTVIDLHQLDANQILLASQQQQQQKQHQQLQTHLTDLSKQLKAQQQQICLTPSSSLAPSSVGTAETLQAVESIQSNNYEPSNPSYATSVDTLLESHYAQQGGQHTLVESNYGQLQQPIANVMRLVKSNSSNFAAQSTTANPYGQQGYRTLNPRCSNYSMLRAKIRKMSEDNRYHGTETSLENPKYATQSGDDDPATLSLLSINTALSSDRFRSSASQLGSPMSVDTGNKQPSLCHYHRLVLAPHQEFLSNPTAVILERTEDEVEQVQTRVRDDLFLIGDFVPPPPQSRAMEVLERPAQE